MHPSRGGGRGGVTHVRSRMILHSRFPTMPSRSTPGFRRPGRHLLAPKARSAVRRPASRMEGELHAQLLNRFVRRTYLPMDGSSRQENCVERVSLPPATISTRRRHPSIRRGPTVFFFFFMAYFYCFFRAVHGSSVPLIVLQCVMLCCDALCCLVW